MHILLLFAATPPLLAWLTRHLERGRTAFAWLLPTAVLSLAPTASSPELRLLCMSLWLLYALKGSVLLQRQRSQVASMSRLGLALYLTLWPGMDPSPLERRERECHFPANWLIQGWITMVVAGVLAGAAALAGLRSSWIPLGLILMFVHLGYSDVLSALVRLLGFPVHRLFDNPLASLGLRDFWSRRWNRPFVEMNRVLFMPLLLPRLGRSGAVAGAFLLSGLLHEVAISFPAGAGWGGPLLYFALQAVGMRLDSRVRGRSTWLRRVWTWTWLLGPLPLLFHEAFRTQLLSGLWQAWCCLPPLQNGPTCLRTLLTLAGWGHFLVLAASFQVPYRLGWFEELQRLRPLNRKLLWVYGGFIVGFISIFGVLILRLAPEMLAGEKGARYLVGLIALFWSARLIVDAIVFEHDDWPQGPEFVIGHTLLTSLFIFLALTCWLVVFFPG